MYEGSRREEGMEVFPRDFSFSANTGKDEPNLASTSNPEVAGSNNGVRTIYLINLFCFIIINSLKIIYSYMRHVPG